MVCIDYKQMEMRMFGALAGDENMLEALRSGRDIHAEIAFRCWGVENDPVRREWAKTVSFGLIYGMTLGSLQYRLNCTYDQAEDICNKYWAAFPRVHDYLFDVIELCKRQRYVTYWSGRRWYEDNELDMYKAANALVQGGSHDLLSVAICRCAAFLQERYPQVKMFNLVHDEIDFIIPINLMQEVVPQLQEIMEVPDLMDLPFLTDVKIGPNYGVMEKWEPGDEVPFATSS